MVEQLLDPTYSSSKATPVLSLVLINPSVIAVVGSLGEGVGRGLCCWCWLRAALGSELIKVTTSGLFLKRSVIGCREGLSSHMDDSGRVKFEVTYSE